MLGLLLRNPVFPHLQVPPPLDRPRLGVSRVEPGKDIRSLDPSPSLFRSGRSRRKVLPPMLDSRTSPVWGPSSRMQAVEGRCRPLCERNQE